MKSSVAKLFSAQRRQKNTLYQRWKTKCCQAKGVQDGLEVFNEIGNTARPWAAPIKAQESTHHAEG